MDSLTTTPHNSIAATFRPLANRTLLGWALGMALVWLDRFSLYLLPEWLLLVLLTVVIIIATRWAAAARPLGQVPYRSAVSAVILPTWLWLVIVPSWLGWMTLSASLARLGLGVVFVTGMGWTVWLVERASRRLLAKRSISSIRGVPLLAMNGLPGQVTVHTSNPLDIDAWYYGRKRRKLNQSATTVAAYSLLFALLVLLAGFLTGCNEIYEMPEGGGEPQLRQQVVRIQKVIRKKYVINPLSAVLFNPPPIEEIKLQLQELTRHIYQVGQGEGKNAGFEGGTHRGMVRFIRLSYPGGDWEQDLDRNADLNMLLWYAANTGHKTAKKPEIRSVRQLKRFPAGKSPPMVYMTGQGKISLGETDIGILHEYLTEKHGMLFADNGGSHGWHSQFFSLMEKVLPKVKPQPVPLDHPVHSGVPFLPVVAPHGGSTAWGWVVDGRLAVYYHPGDVGDAWADGHAGVPRQVWESGFRLGGNILLYAHSEYSRWLTAKNNSD
ncbi:MAG: DUF4159 domain-containing protein [Verrucomicrobiota bacterium]|nr:DUF4159 domain-containing protein [Verrucomicrobiota bacterium]MDP7048564.1 DUF4159 domain-containing protein [Verrucomicrobiota bacterium]